MSYYSLPRGKLHKKNYVRKLDNFSSAYSRLFYKQKANDADIDLPSVIAEQVVRQGEPLTEDIKKFLLGTSDYANELQSDIDLYVTRGKHNQTSFHRKLDPIAKNVWIKENPLELLFAQIP